MLTIFFLNRINMFIACDGRPNKQRKIVSHPCIPLYESEISQNILVEFLIILKFKNYFNFFCIYSFQCSKIKLYMIFLDIYVRLRIKFTSKTML